MKKIILLYCFASFVVLSLKAQQEPLFTDYNSNITFYNPSYSGKEIRPEFNLAYRKNWVGFDNSPTTINLGFNTQIRENKKAGIGALLFADFAGITRQIGLKINYAYHVKLNDKYNLSIGLGGTIRQFRIDNQKAIVNDLDDVTLQTYGEQEFSLSSNAGFVFYSKGFSLGFAMPNTIQSKINPSTYSSSKYYRHYIFTTQYKRNFSEKLSIEPSLLIKYTPAIPIQYDFNIYAHFYEEFIMIGAGYRENNYLTLSLGVKVLEQFKILYHYDIPMDPDIKSHSKGSHEVGIRYKLKPKAKHEKTADIISDN